MVVVVGRGSGGGAGAGVGAWGGGYGLLKHKIHCSNKTVLIGIIV